jgi:hypothetical protein
VAYRVLILIPVYYRQKELLKCLEALSRTDIGENQVKVTFAVNGCTPKSLEHLMAVIGKRVTGLPKGGIGWIHVFNKNIGKGQAINECILRELMDHNHDYIVSLDQDMVATSTSWLLDMIRLSQVKLDCSRLGAVVAEQSGSSMHLPVNPRRIYVDEDPLTFSDGNKGLAGGCLLASSSMWGLVRGYRMGCIFGGDDTGFMHGLHSRGHQAAIANDVVFFHPGDGECFLYSEWKKRALAGTLAMNEKDGFLFKDEV